MLRQRVHKRRSPSLATQSTNSTLFSNLPRSITPTRSLPTYTHSRRRHDHLEQPPPPPPPDPATDQDAPQPPLRPRPPTVLQPPPATSATSHTGNVTNVGVVPLPGPTEEITQKPSGSSINVFEDSDSSGFVLVNQPGTIGSPSSTTGIEAVSSSAAWTPDRTTISGRTSIVSQNGFSRATARVEEPTSSSATVASASSISQGALVSSTPSPSTQSRSNHIPIVLGAVIGGLAVVVFAFVLFIVVRRQRRKRMAVVEVEKNERGHISVVFETPQDRRDSWEVEVATLRNLLREDERDGENKPQAPLDIPPVIPPIPTLSNGRLSIFETVRSDSPTDMPKSPRLAHKRSISQRVAEFLKSRSSHEQASRPNMKWQGRPLPPVPSFPPPSPNGRVGRYIPSALSQYTVTAPPAYEVHKNFDGAGHLKAEELL